MAPPTKSQAPSRTPALGVLAGCFLSGSMTGLSLIAVPVLLETVSSPSHLFTQWARMYHHGHTTMPFMAIGTFSCYLYAAYQARSSNKRNWKRFVYAGLVTLVMIPFTWVVMAPTNSRLHWLEAQGAAHPDVNMETARVLLTRWKWLHYARSAFPLFGAWVGLNALG